MEVDKQWPNLQKLFIQQHRGSLTFSDGSGICFSLDFSKLCSLAISRPVYRPDIWVRYSVLNDRLSSPAEIFLFTAPSVVPLIKSYHLTLVD